MRCDLAVINVAALLTLLKQSKVASMKLLMKQTVGLPARLSDQLCAESPLQIIAVNTVVSAAII